MSRGLRIIANPLVIATLFATTVASTEAPAGTLREVSRDIGRICRSLLKSWTFKKPKLSNQIRSNAATTINELNRRLHHFAQHSDLHPYDQFDWATFLLLTTEDYELERKWVRSHLQVPSPLIERLPSQPLAFNDTNTVTQLSVEPTESKKSLIKQARVNHLSPRELIMNPPNSPESIFKTFKDSLLAMPSFTPIRNSLLGATELIHDMIFGNSDHAYATGGSTSEANYGLIQYIAHQLENDLTLLEASIRFYTILRFYDQGVSFTLSGGAFQLPSVLIWERHQIDVWQLALNACHGDVVLALRVIGVFGHDDIKQLLPRPKNAALVPHFKLLNSLIPTRQSQLYFPGALPGLDIPERFRTEIDRLHDDYQTIYAGDDSEDEEKYQSRFRAGYYHFIGGINTGTELTRHGYGKVAGFKLPVVLAEQMGYFYKKITMLQTYMSDDARTLYHLGLTQLGKTIQRPEHWNDHRFAQAKLETEMSLLFLELGAYQHREGANWAFNQIIKATRSRSSSP